MNVIYSCNNNLFILRRNIVFESDQNFSQVGKSSIDRSSDQRQSADFLQNLFKRSIESSFTIFMNWIDLKLL